MAADHVLAGLDGRIAAVLDAGPCEVGLESTIVGVSDGVSLLRPGGLAIEDIERIVGPVAARGVDEAISAPGQLASHYAPDARLRLNALDLRDGEILLGFGQVAGAEMNLSLSGNLVEAAANLFDYLHRMDALADGRTIAVSPIPQSGLGIAINDRLYRAAAPRE